MKSILNEWREAYQNEIAWIADEIDDMINSEGSLDRQRAKEIGTLINGEITGAEINPTIVVSTDTTAIFNIGAKCFNISKESEASAAATRKMTAQWRKIMQKPVNWHGKGLTDEASKEIIAILTCLAHRGRPRSVKGGLIHDVFEMDALTLHLLAAHAQSLGRARGANLATMSDEEKGQLVFAMVDEITSWRIPGLNQDGIFLHMESVKYEGVEVKGDIVRLLADMPDSLLNADHSKRPVIDLVEIHRFNDGWKVTKSTRVKEQVWTSREILQLTTNRYHQKLRRRVVRKI